MRIYADESGTHGDEWLIIGMLFVPDHGSLHRELCRVKSDTGYLNRSTKRKAQWKESTLKDFKRPGDVDVAERWFDVFAASDAYFRAIAIDWNMWDGSFFGDAFEPDALKRRRAYKKWAEQLLQPEISSPLPGRSPIRGAEFYLDRLRIMYGYDILEHLQERFAPPDHYAGSTPYITKFHHTRSWLDANQCLQLCDLMVGCLYQTLVPSQNQFKLATRDALASRLRPLGVERLDAGYWRQYHPRSLRQKQPRFSAWFWLPEGRRGGAKPAKRGRRK